MTLLPDKVAVVVIEQRVMAALLNYNQAFQGLIPWTRTYKEVSKAVESAYLGTYLGR